MLNKTSPDVRVTDSESDAWCTTNTSVYETPSLFTGHAYQNLECDYPNVEERMGPQTG